MSLLTLNQRYFLNNFGTNGGNISCGSSAATNNFLQAALAAYTRSAVINASVGSGNATNNLINGTYNVGFVDALRTSANLNNQPENYVQIPFILQGVAIVCNLQVDNIVLTKEIIAKIYAGTITYWNDAKIVAVNPTIKLPNKTIKVAMLSSGNGGAINTLLGEYLATIDSSTFAKSTSLYQSGLPPSSKATSTTYTTSGLLADYIENTANSIGYFFLSDAITANVKVARLINKQGKTVNLELSSLYSAALNEYNKITPNIDSLIDASGNGSYPIASYGYALVKKDTNAASTNTTAIDIAKWLFYLTQANYAQIKADCLTFGYGALPPELSKYAMDKIVEALPAINTTLPTTP